MDQPRQLSAEDFTARARALRWLLCDVDGVLTDGRVYYGADGHALVGFDIKDGLGLKLAQACGLRVGVLSGRSSEALLQRARELGLDAVVMGRTDKGAAFTEFLAAHEIDARAVAYLGDDLPDLAILRRCGLALAPADAVPEVRTTVHRLLERRGGHGAVREAIEAILRARGEWDRALAAFSG